MTGDKDKKRTGEKDKNRINKNLIPVTNSRPYSIMLQIFSPC
jgi:hypothetical protein